VYSTNYYSPNNFKFYTTNNGAQNIVAGGLGVMGEYANEGKIPGNGIYSQGQIKSDSTVTAPSFVGELTGNSATTTKLKNAVRINSVLFDGTTNITTPGYINLISSDNRTIRPSQLAPDSLGVYFTSLAGMNGVADNNFADLLAINTYRDNTAGLMSGLAFPKSGMQNPIHYRTDYGSATWGVGRRLAYLDDDSTGNSATASRLNKTTRITTTQAVTWYRLGKVTIPQNGRTLAIRMYGGVGYNGLSNQSAATVIFKTGNANPVNAGVAMDVLDGTSIPGQVGLLKLDDSNYEIFVQFGGYSTFNCVVEEEEGTTWTWQYASYATLPAGFQAGTVRVLAQTTSNVSSATRLQTPRTINGVSFNGTSDITIADNTKLPLSGGTLTGGLKAITLNAAGAGGYSPSGQGAYLSWNRSEGQGKTDFINNRGGGPGGFDWWNGNESGYTQLMYLDSNGVLSAIGGFNGNATTATSLQTARTINGVSFNGTANITIADNTKLPLTGGAMTGQITTKATATATEVTGLGTGSTAPIKVPAWNVGTTYGFAPFLHGSAHSSAGYLTQVSFGAYKPESTWTNSGAYIAVGGSNANPTEAFLFQNGRKISNNAGAISLVGNADTATKLQTSRTINGVPFDGTANITVEDSTKLPTAGGTITGSLNVSDTITVTNVGDQVNAFKKLIQASTTTDGGYLAVGNNGADKGYVEIGTIDDADAEIYASQRTSANAVLRRAKLLDGSGNTSFTGTVTAPTFSGALSGNAATATSLQTARTINGVSFDGTANITVADSTKLPLAGGSLSGRLTSPSILIDKSSKTASGISWYSSTYTSWQDYMAQAGTTENGVLGNLTAPSGALVTSWGKRSVIEPSAGYGWTFETVTMSGTTPTIVAEISSTGESRWSGAMTVVGNITATGNITAFSDARLKENITKIPDALNKLNQLKGVTYTRKDLATNQQYAGLIAQDVQKALPEAVAITEGDTLAVDYNGVIGLLVEAIKELNNRIDKLERI
jgi:hypothetical protein